MMVTGSALTEEAIYQLEQIGHADIVIGIPSYNNAATIRYVIETAAQGAAGHFPHLRTAVVNSDGGSTDGTRESALHATLPPGVERIVTVYQGLPGKGSALRAIFEAAQRLGAQLCIVLDSDLRSITPQWMERLGRPIMSGEYDYVTPYYVRDKYDGTITNNIVYPMTRMLYGVEVRQPIGGDFAVGARLLDTYLQQEVWESDVARYGIDIWMTTTAINTGARICQAYLGAKIHDAKDPAAALGPMFRQVVGTLFHLMARYAERWKSVHRVQPAPIYGTVEAITPEPVPVNLEAMIGRLHQGREEWQSVWEQVLSPHNRQALTTILSQRVSAFRFEAAHWADMVLDYAVAYHRGVLDHGQMMDSMVPLYYGRTASMVVESQAMDLATFEHEVVQTQAEIFERLKPQLIARWETTAPS
ncbi:MAG: glycosyltransferase family 2 protein [Anaerolineae bacterium]